MRKQLFQILSVFILASLALAACGALAPQVIVTATPEIAATPDGDAAMAAVLANAVSTVIASTSQANGQVTTSAPLSTVMPNEASVSSAACPNDPSVMIVWPGYNSPNDKNRYEVGYGTYKKVCFPNGGAILASYVRINGHTFDDVASCDRDNKPQETCGYLLNIPPGVVAEFHTGVAGTIYPDSGGELNGADGNIHPWIVNITAEVFP